MDGVTEYLQSLQHHHQPSRHRLPPMAFSNPIGGFHA
jgi:hypothetical protein